MERKEKELKELKQCTFRPKINKRVGKVDMFGVGTKNSEEIRKIIDQAKTSDQNSDQTEVLRELLIQSNVFDTSADHLEQIIENNVPKQMPKGYAKVVERLRRPQEYKENIQKEVDKNVIGQRYSQKKLKNMKPPSFLERELRKKRIPSVTNYYSMPDSMKGPIILSIEVSISAYRTAIINIREGDDLKVVTRCFCMTHNLNKSMENILLSQLK